MKSKKNRFYIYFHLSSSGLMSRRVSTVALVGPGLDRRGSRWDAARRLTISSSHRMSFGDGSGPRRPTHARLPLVKLENTYQLDPKSDQRFREGAVREVVLDVIKDIIGETTYDPENCSFVAKRLSNVIRTQVRDLGFSRYKLVVLVHMGALDQDSNTTMTSRCLWRPESGDSFVDVRYENKSLYVMVTVYALYFE